ncbi:hypothetical protein QJS10_CPA08g01221 [Acorus calamus]|uniref:Uncharacterized protein n=1 Tax=Acorus calamus TaxID=4465 RepID=A0AAV9E9S3_ACOCL|nr:hypothetical protein QJS10_CPA08g01221 [Acorus calamus]
MDDQIQASKKESIEPEEREVCEANSRRSTAAQTPDVIGSLKQLVRSLFLDRSE